MPCHLMRVQGPTDWRVLLGAWFGPRPAALRWLPRYRSAAYFIEVFRTSYGPVHKACAAFPADGAAALERDLSKLLQRLNVAGNPSLVVPSEHLEGVFTRR
jgi:hypothetical protein